MKTKSTKELRVSAVIPALNEEANIAACISSLQRQTVSPLEIVVADNGSTDRTRDIARKMNCRVVRVAERGIGNARNGGAKAAVGEIVAFIDADGEARPEWVAEILNSIKNEQADAVTGLGIYSADRWDKKILYNSYTYAGMLLGVVRKMAGKKPGLIGNNLAMKREAFLKIGGFPPVHAEGFWLTVNFWKQENLRGVFNSKMQIVYSSRGFEAKGFWRTLLFWGKNTLRKSPQLDYNFESDRSLL